VEFVKEKVDDGAVDGVTALVVFHNIVHVLQDTLKDMINLTPKNARILHWTLRGIALVLIAIELIQIFTGQKVDQVIAWAAIIILLTDLFITRMSSKKKSTESD
jgi:hypothetical protein